MAFDEKLFDAPATSGQVAGVAIKASIIGTRLVAALELLQQGKSLQEEIAEVRKQSLELEELFDHLVGWRKEG